MDLFQSLYEGRYPLRYVAIEILYGGEESEAT